MIHPNSGVRGQPALDPGRTPPSSCWAMKSNANRQLTRALRLCTGQMQEQLADPFLEEFFSHDIDRFHPRPSPANAMHTDFS